MLSYVASKLGETRGSDSVHSPPLDQTLPCKRSRKQTAGSRKLLLYSALRELLKLVLLLAAKTNTAAASLALPRHEDEVATEMSWR